MRWNKGAVRRGTSHKEVSLFIPFGRISRELAQLLMLSAFTDIRIPLTHLEDRFEGIVVSFFQSSSSKSVTVNSFNAGRALERIGQSDFEKMYQVMALSAIKQAGIPIECYRSKRQEIAQIISRQFLRGIYYVKDGVLFPTQIVVTKERNPQEHIWLTALSDGMQKQQLKDLLAKVESFHTKLERELADAVLGVAIKANWQVAQELRGDGNMCEALMELMEPKINKIKENVREETTQQGIKNAIAALKDSGHTL